MPKAILVAMIIISFGAAVVLGMIDYETRGFLDLLTAENLPFIFIFAILAFAIQAWLVGISFLAVRAGSHLFREPARERSSV